MAAASWRTATTRWSATPATLVDHELRRLPPADRGQLEDRAAPLRGRRDAQLRHLQPAGGARRDVPAGPPGTARAARSRRCARLGAGAVVHQRQPRAHLRAAAAGRGQRLLLAGVRPHFPHTERKTETKTCRTATCRERNDNNAIMAQLLMQGTNFVNFVGLQRLGRRRGDVEAVQVTEWDEPQAVIGSYLHRYAYPTGTAHHEQRGPGAAHGTVPPQRPRSMPAAARRVPVRRRRRGGMRCTTWPASPTRASRSASSPRRSRAGPGHAHPSAERHLRGAAHQPAGAPAAQPGRADARDQPGAALPPDLQLRLDHRRASRADPHRRQHPGRRRAAQQLPQRALTWNPDGVLTGART
jgi:hypothetical protein